MTLLYKTCCSVSLVSVEEVRVSSARHDVIPCDFISTSTRSRLDPLSSSPVPPMLRYASFITLIRNGIGESVGLTPAFTKKRFLGDECGEVEEVPDLGVDAWKVT